MFVDLFFRSSNRRANTCSGALYLMCDAVCLYCTFHHRRSAMVKPCKRRDQRNPGTKRVSDCGGPGECILYLFAFFSEIERTLYNTKSGLFFAPFFV
jgi:hypothetical protein